MRQVPPLLWTIAIFLMFLIPVFIVSITLVIGFEYLTLMELHLTHPADLTNKALVRLLFVLIGIIVGVLCCFFSVDCASDFNDCYEIKKGEERWEKRLLKENAMMNKND